jgi:hypothetical protein
MTGLNHDFLLLSTREHPYIDYMKWINHRKATRIHDDVMHYMQDTINWITCYNPAQKMRKHRGLNFYGPTIIKKDGTANAERLFTAWANLFSIGPKTIKLTGAYGWYEGESKETGSYSVIRLERDEIVDRLRSVADYAKSVANSNDELFILHLGI